MSRFFLVLFSLLLVGTANSPVWADKRVALVVGIDAYENLDLTAQLKKARSDAAALARTLKELGFDVIAKDDLTRSEFNAAWTDFLGKLEPGDMATFYFAGHGVEFGGRNYLIPKDVPDIKPGRDELLKRESLSLQEFLEDLREKGTRLNLVILDACRDNPFRQLAGRSVGRTRGLAISEPPEGTFIMFSAGTGESALDRLNDDDADPNSVYTRNLLPLLKTRGLSLTDVAEAVRLQVRKLAATADHRQTPAYYNQMLGRVCLAGCAEVRPVPQFRIVSPMGGSTVRGGRTAVKIAIEATPDPAKLINVHVNGRHVDTLRPDPDSGGFGAGPLVFNVPLAEGKNDVRFTLTNDIGDKVQALVVHHDGEGALDKRGRLYVVAIGVDKYPGFKTCGITGTESCDLSFAGADARALVGAVEKRLAPAHEMMVTRLLVNGAGEKNEPTAANILDAIDILKKAEETDTVVLFLAGHSSQDGPNYRFLPTNVEVVDGVLRRSTMISMEEIQDAVESAMGRRLVFIDTGASSKGRAGRRNTYGISFNSVVVYTAARFDQSPFEDVNLGHGLFTYALIEGLEGKGGAAERRQISTKKLADYVIKRVAELAETRHHSQEPQFFSGGDADEDYVLARW
jgi:uncharacterized caspase-like protein